MISLQAKLPGKKHCNVQWTHGCPSKNHLHGSVVDDDTAFGHHLFQVAQAQRVGRVPAHAQQHDIQRIEYLAKRRCLNLDGQRNHHPFWLTPLMRQSPNSLVQKIRNQLPRAQVQRFASLVAR